MKLLTGPGAALVAAVFAILGTARFVPIIDIPWEANIGAYNASLFAGEISRNWNNAGFLQLKGMPCVTYIPASPPIIGHYLHHPPAYQWAVHLAATLFGRSERSFRIVPIFGAALGVFFVVLLAGRTLGALGAVLAGLAWLCIPMSLRYDWMPNPESLATGLIAGGIYFHWRTRDASAKRYGMTWLCAFAACQADWQGAFLGPALVLLEMLGFRSSEPSWRRIGRALSTAVPIVASVAATVGIFSLWLGSPADAVNHLLSTKSKAGWEDRAASAGLSLQTWWSGNSSFLLRMYTWPVLAAAAAGALLLFRSRTRPVAGIGCAMALPGLLNITVFGSHSAFHEFWTYYALPGLAFLFALACVQVGRWYGLALAAAVLTFAGAESYRLHAENRTSLWRDAGKTVNAALLPRDILLVPPDLDLMVFYVNAPTYVMRRGPEDLYAALHVKRELELDAGRLVLLLPAQTPPEDMDAYRAVLRANAPEARIEEFSLEAGQGAGPTVVAYIE